ncbi:winged helix DNA-binding domain-containing protein [Nocardia suismassiliense]|uniref:winged helix DNA-binding domain-containing protein n=1 Tax=Nocardia suismassiliense TaxID=2077092 RepID=UPI000D1DF1F4|nr:winged helix DNA-binding domain-containing protein [Nocardia suismassiliense]
MAAREPLRRTRSDVLSSRALNRALLERQLLLRRTDLSVAAAVEQVLGLNAQDPNLPYLALWNRLSDFTIGDLTAAIEDRTLVRSTMMRATQHLMSVPDFRLVRPMLAPLLLRVQRNAFGRRTEGIDLDALVADATALLCDGQVLTRPELGRLLAEQRPGADPSALGWTAQYLVPVVHPAPSGTWNVRGATPFAGTEWIAMPSAATDADRRQLVRRYLAAFGPATAADARAWSGVGGLRDVFEQLRPELRCYTDELGRKLFDLPDAPRPDADLPAPVRLLPEFDATLLAHADRTRIMTKEVRAQVCIGAGVAATVLVDGTVAAIWTRTRIDDTEVLTVRPLRPLAATDRAAIEAEAHNLLAFATPAGTDHDVRLLPYRIK